jgi:signal transduction histidine kinase
MLDEKRYDGVAFVLDITVRKNAERALKESEERFRLALRNAPVSVAVQDLYLRYIWSYNQRTDPLGGIVGKTDEEIFAPDEAAHLRAMKTRVLEENIKIHEQMWFDGPAGRIFLDLYWEPVHDEAGRVTGVGSATVNLTPLKEAETNLKELTEQLQEKNKELESFSYSVSHDLRAPLRAIDGFADMLLKDVGDQLDPESMRKFNVIRRNAQKMDKLVEDLLKRSRAGRAPVSQSRFDMVHLVKDVWEELQAGHPDRSMELKINGLPPASGDRALVRQVLSNLLGNAVKFTRNRDRATIEISGSVSDGFNTYSIRDNGTGFDMCCYERLFGVFHRLHSEKEFEGTGIGLAIVKKIIDKHGGRIWAEGKPGEGAAFFFSLPAGNQIAI